MCMQTKFGCKLIDGKIEDKKNKKNKIIKNKKNKKIIHQSKVDFE